MGNSHAASFTPADFAIPIQDQLMILAGAGVLCLLCLGLWLCFMREGRKMLARHQGALSESDSSRELKKDSLKVNNRPMKERGNPSHREGGLKPSHRKVGKSTSQNESSKKGLVNYREDFKCNTESVAASLEAHHNPPFGEDEGHTSIYPSLEEFRQLVIEEEFNSDQEIQDKLSDREEEQLEEAAAHYRTRAITLMRERPQVAGKYKGQDCTQKVVASAPPPLSRLKLGCSWLQLSPFLKILLPSKEGMSQCLIDNLKT